MKKMKDILVEAQKEKRKKSRGKIKHKCAVRVCTLATAGVATAIIFASKSGKEKENK